MNYCFKITAYILTVLCCSLIFYIIARNYEVKSALIKAKESPSWERRFGVHLLNLQKEVRFGDI